MITDRTSEVAEAELDRFIERRGLRADAEQQRVEDLWKESERRHREKLREQHRWEWIRYFECLAANHRGLAEANEARAAALLAGEGEVV